LYGFALFKLDIFQSWLNNQDFLVMASSLFGFVLVIIQSNII